MTEETRYVPAGIGTATGGAEHGIGPAVTRRREHGSGHTGSGLAGCCQPADSSITVRESVWNIVKHKNGRRPVCRKNGGVRRRTIRQVDTGVVAAVRVAIQIYVHQRRIKRAFTRGAVGGEKKGFGAVAGVGHREGEDLKGVPGLDHDSGRVLPDDADIDQLVHPRDGDVTARGVAPPSAIKVTVAWLVMLVPGGVPRAITAGTGRQLTKEHEKIQPALLWRTLSSWAGLGGSAFSSCLYAGLFV